MCGGGGESGLGDGRGGCGGMRDALVDKIQEERETGGEKMRCVL